MEYLVLPAARQRPRRAHRDGRDQPRQAPLLPAAGVPGAARRATSLRLAIDQVGDRLARRQPRVLRHAASTDAAHAGRQGRSARRPERSASTSAADKLPVLSRAASLGPSTARRTDPSAGRDSRPPRACSSCSRRARGRRNGTGISTSRVRPAADEQLEADLEAAGLDRARPARSIAPDQEEAGRGVANRRQRRGQQARRRATCMRRVERPVRRAAARHVAAARRARRRSVRAKHRQHPRHERRRMAEVGVHDADDVGAARRRTPTTAVPSPSLPARWMTCIAMRARQLVGDRAGAVRRVVVDDHELERRRRAGAHASNSAVDEFRQPIALVVGRHDHRQVGRLWTRVTVSTIIQGIAAAAA